MRVLIVEDDPDLRNGVAAALRKRGFAVDEADDLATAELQLGVNTYDCLVLDRMLPSGDALDLLEDVRRDGLATPALFLTARDAVTDRVAGFEAGGDDYLVKPFAMDELLARVSSLSRRAADVRPAVLQVGDLELDAARREVRRAGVLLSLRAKEFAVLELLVARAGEVVTRSDLIEACWDELNDPLSNVIDVHIAKLRRILGDPPLIETMRGVGYRLAPSDA